jgi:hypothetical protein
MVMKKEKTAAVLGGIFATTLALPARARSAERAGSRARGASRRKAEASQSPLPPAEFPVPRALIDQYCTAVMIASVLPAWC